MQMHPWICRICWSSTLWDVDVDISGYHDWQLRPKQIRWLRVVVAAPPLNLSSPPFKHFVVRCNWNPSTSIWSKEPVFHRITPSCKRKKKKSLDEKNNCAGTWPWQWLLRSMSVACVLMRPSLNWSWVPWVAWSLWHTDAWPIMLSS